MAKIKTETKAPVDNTVDETEKILETVPESTDETKIETEKIETEKQDKEGLEDGSDTNTVQELSDNIQRILKLYSNMSELYIDKFGGVFTPDTKASIRGKAVLYKNPFYKSNKQ